MPPRRRISADDGHAALERWELDPDATATGDLRTAVRFTLEEFAERYPGGAVEIRIPPHGATQALPGPRHTRGTPPAIIETDALTWLELVCGSLSYREAVAASRIQASGLRTDLTEHLPLFSEGQAGPQ